MLTFNRSGEILQIDARCHKGRILFTTDLHGHYDLLHEKLKDVAFDSSVDILVSGADWCDRGPDSQHVLDYLNEPWIYSVRGNHEQMIIDYIEALAEAGGDDRSVRQPFEMLFFNGGQWFFDIKQSHQMRIYESFKSLPLAIELLTPTEKIGIIHAQCPYNNWDEFKKMTDAELDFNGAATAQWARTNYNKQADIQVKGIDRLLVGHSPTRSGEVEVYGNTTYADLGSFFRDKISFIQLM